MKRTTLLLLFASSLAVGQAVAAPTYIDVSASSQTPGGAGTGIVMGGDVDTFTTIFEQMALFADTTTTQYDTDGSGTLTIGDRFIDSGHASVTDLFMRLALVFGCTPMAAAIVFACIVHKVGGISFRLV